MDLEETEPEPGNENAAAGLFEEQPMLYCPLCSQRLSQSRCKLVCDKCGYFMSCADYY
jgi:hypothetical protein